MRSDGVTGTQARAAAREVGSVEMLIGIALIVIAAALIVFIIRTVQGNMGTSVS